MKILKTTINFDIPKPSGIINAPIYAELVNPQITANFNEFKYFAHYYYESEIDITTPEGESETIIKKNTLGFLEEKKSMSNDINPLFNYFGKDILKTDDFKQGLQDNLMLIFEGVIKNGGYYGCLPEQWELID